MKKLVLAFMFMIFFAFLLGCGNDVPTTIKYEDMKLQNLFAQITFRIRAADIENYIVANELKYTRKEYNHGDNIVYKVAFTDSDALQRYGTSGDNVEIEFNYDGSLLHAEYCNSHNYMVALLYNYGTHWSFNEKQPNNIYSGYYYYKAGDDKNDGIVIRYSNGYENKTSYHKVSSADNALLAVINK